MLNEWKEFQDYTGTVNYTARNKQDTTYLGRFTFDTILDFEEMCIRDRMIAIFHHRLRSRINRTVAQSSENAWRTPSKLITVIRPMCARVTS